MSQSVSIINLMYMNDLATAVDGLAPLIIEATGTYAEELKEARYATQPGPTDNYFSGMVDLVDWIDQVDMRIDDPQIDAKLAELRFAADLAVTRYYIEPEPLDSNPHNRHHGLSVGFTTLTNHVGRFRDYNLYDDLGYLHFYQDTLFDEMATGYFDVY